MSRYADVLNHINEGAQPVDIEEILTTSAVIESDKVLIRCAVLLGKEFTRAMLAMDPNERLAILEKTLKDARALRSVASKIPDDTITDYSWAMLTCWWRGAIKYGVGAIKNAEGIETTTRNSTLSKFDMLITFLKAEIARTKLEAAKQRKLNYPSTA